MANLKLEFETSDGYSGKLTNVAVTKYDYNKYGLQMYDDLSYNLNFQTFDIENLENRAATYSKTLKLPGTAVNNDIFSNLFDIDVDIITNYKTSNFTDDVFFGKKINCELLYDTIPVKEGFFELTKVYYNESLRQIEYEGEFYSKSKSFSEDVGDKLLTGNEDIGEDLDFSLYDHPFTFFHFLNSHSGYYYENSKGFYYPIIDYVNLSEHNWTGIESFRPSLYVKEIIDKIFEMAGYTYSSTFFNSEFFKSLIIPWTGQVKLDDEELELRNLKVGMEPIGTNTDYTGKGPVIWGNSSWGYEYRDFYNDSVQKPGENSNPTQRTIPLDKDSPDPYYNSADEDFDIGTHKWVVPAKGKYRITWASTQDIYGIRWVNGTGQAGYTLQAGDKMVEFKLQLYKLPGGASTPELIKEYKTLKYLPFVAGDTWVPTWTDSITWSGELLQGDEVYAVISLNNYNAWYDDGGRPVIVRLWVNAAATQSFEVISEPGFQLYEGELVEMRNALPQGQKQIDFFKDIVNMFNLVIDEYPNSDRKLLIEKRDDYYFSGTTLNWTNKEDISQAGEIERIPTLINKDFKLSYKADKDDLNVLYEDDNRGLIYGNHKVKNPYLSNSTYDVKVNFSSTPLSTLGFTNWGVSKICATDDRGNVKEQEFNNRILYRKNIPAQDVPQVPEGYLLPYYIVYNKTESSSFGYSPFHGGTDWNYQPYAGHLDSPYVPTLDLNFGLCNNYYYPHLPDNMTTNNIYESYWKTYVAELMDLNSKRVTKYIKLEVDDIYNLSFSSKIWIDGVLYVLDKINDWNPGQITKVELLKLSKYDLDTTPPADYKTNTKLKKKTPVNKKQEVRLIDLQQPYSIDLNHYLGVTGQTSGGSMESWSGDTTYTDFISKKNIYSASAIGVIIGDNNQVSNDGGIFIKGNNNTIESGATNISIFADNVSVKEGVSNVVVLGNEVQSGTTRTEITQSNFIYMPTGYTINNVYTKSETVKVVDDAVSGITVSGASEAWVTDNFRSTGSTVDWSYVNNKPKSAVEYGITDIYTTGETYSKTQTDSSFASKAGNFSYVQKTTQKFNSTDVYIIGDDYNGTGRTITLMSAYAVVGKVYLIQDEVGNAAANNITIQTQGLETINGSSTKTISTNYGTSFLYCDGTNWFGL